MTIVRRWARAIALTVLVAAATRTGAAVPAGTPITNQASLTYTDDRSTVYTATSNEVIAVVAVVSGVSLTPSEQGCNIATDSFAADKPLIKTFYLVNGGNQPDAFMLSPVTASAGHVASVTFIQANQSYPATGGARSPVVAANGMLQVVVSVNATGMATGTQVIVSVSVHSTTAGSQNGTSSAAAVQCGVAASGANLSGSTGAGSPIVMLVNGLPATQSSAGAIVTYGIAFTNFGGSAADGVTLTDPFPNGMTYVPATAKLNGTPLPAQSIRASGQTLALSLGAVQANQAVAISYQAVVSAQAHAGQSLVNVGSVTSSNAAAKTTEPAAILVGNANAVFDGNLGAQAPIAGATLTLIPDTIPANRLEAVQPVALLGQAVAPNTKNANPYVTDLTGTYAFGLAPKQAGIYDLIVTAPAYVTRRIKIQTTADTTGTYYRAVMTALDGQPVTSPGTYDLASESVTLGATYGLFGNVPMFRSSNVTISKIVDRPTASAGSRLVYTIEIQNGASALGATTVFDDLPRGIAYAPGTARVDGIAVEPARGASSLRWSFRSLVELHKIVFDAVILPSIGEESVLTNVATVASHVSTSATYTVGARATATTDIVAGVFTNRTIITGRVYLDVSGFTRFGRDDVGVAGVRIYLESGEYVTTDSEGKYDFPSVRPGMHILRLDRTSLPPGALPYDDRRFDSERSVRRLVHDPYDGGLMQNVDFAVKRRT